MPLQYDRDRDHADTRVVGPDGFEPSASPLSGVRDAIRVIVSTCKDAGQPRDSLVGRAMYRRGEPREDATDAEFVLSRREGLTRLLALQRLRDEVQAGSVRVLAGLRV